MKENVHRVFWKKTLIASSKWRQTCYLPLAPSNLVTPLDSRRQNLYIFPKIFFNVVITSELNFCLISGIFPTYFNCFLRRNTTKKSLNYVDFTKPFLCNIRSLETCRLQDRDEIWNLRDRDSQKWVSRLVSRPRPSLETPSLALVILILML